MFLFKGYALIYPNNSIIPEVIILFVYLVLQFFKIRLFSMGNKNETSLLIIIGIIFLIPIVIIYIYYLALQMYVVVYDIILNAFGLILLLLQLFTGGFTMIKVISNEKKL